MFNTYLIVSSNTQHIFMTIQSLDSYQTAGVFFMNSHVSYRTYDVLGPMLALGPCCFTQSPTGLSHCGGGQRQLIRPVLCNGIHSNRMMRTLLCHFAIQWSNPLARCTHQRFSACVKPEQHRLRQVLYCRQSKTPVLKVSSIYNTGKIRQITINQNKKRAKQK